MIQNKDIIIEAYREKYPNCVATKKGEIISIVVKERTEEKAREQGNF